MILGTHILIIIYNDLQKIRKIMGNFQMKIEKKIGRRTYEFTVEGQNLHEAVMESRKLSFGDVQTCGCCGKDNLILDAHVAQNKYKYTTVKCLDCRASVNFGVQQENPDVFYLRKDDNKNYDWQPAPAQNNGGQQMNNMQQPQQPQQPQQQFVQQPNQNVAQQQVQNYTQQPRQ